MLKKILYVFWMIVGFIPSSHASPLTLPQEGSTVDSFAPEGWYVHLQAEGDLNKDNLADVAFVLAPNWEKDGGFAPDGDDRSRVLVLLFKTADGKLKLSATKENFIMGAHDGGMMGDPLNLAIERGAVVVSFYGGSRNRWGMTYRFRWQNNDWYLIGYTSLSADNLELTSGTTDVNWSTGGIVIESTKEGKTINSSKATKKLPPLTLKDFTMEKVSQLMEE